MDTIDSGGIDHFKDQESAPYVLGNTVGRGQCTVKRAKKKSSGEGWPLAQKIIELDQVTMGPVRQAFLEEVKILRNAKHHHVIEFIAAYEVENPNPQLAIVMGRAKGNIQDFLSGKRRKQCDLEWMGQWFGCLASVVEYIHGIGIRHRDIKPGNILVDNKRVFLADFGISKMFLIETLSTTVPSWARARTSSHCAPEVENGSSRGKSADIFSLGAVFLELLLARSHGFVEIDKLAAKVTINNETSYAKRVDQLHEWMEAQLRKWEAEGSVGEWDRGMLSLCQSMLHKERDKRPKAFQVLDKLSSLSSTGSAPNLCTCAGDIPTTNSASEAGLVEACKAGSLEEVTRLIDKNTPPSSIGALHQASVRGHLSIVKLLLVRGADVNLQDHSKQTALHCAAGGGHDEIVDILLEHGATATLLNIEGRTALHSAVGCGRAKVVEMLLDKERGRADVTVEDHNLQTALHFAAKRGNKEAVQMLLTRLSPENREKYVGLPDKQGMTPLHFAAGYGSEEVVRILLEHGANPNKVDSQRWTALHIAARGKHVDGNYGDVGTLLLEKGAKCMEMDKNGLMAIWFADEGSPLHEVLSNAMRQEQIMRQEQKYERGGKMREGASLASRGSIPGVSNSATPDRQPEPSTGANEREEKPEGNLLTDFHADFLSFLAISQYHNVDTWPLVWDASLDMLGKGATGDVRQLVVDPKSRFAFKRFASHRGARQPDVLPDSATSFVFQSNEKLFTALISELVILSQPQVKQHRHIVDITAITFDVEGGGQQALGVWPVLVMQKAQHGSLAKYMASEGGKTNDLSARLDLCAQIGSAISTMHSNNIVHGDIKPQNVLVYEDGEALCAKVTDFSYSCLGKSEGGVVKLPKSEPWHAPEYVSGGVKIEDAKLMDVYSFGMICLWLLFPTAFDGLTNSRTARGRGDGQTDIQAAAQELASKEDSLKLSSRQLLAEFFGNTLCLEPSKRQRDWQILVKYLERKLWQPPSGQDSIFDGTRRLTLADYHATAQDIEDPEKLQVLTRKILDSLHLTGKDYDTMREHLDSTKFTDKMRTERYINTVLEGLSKFAVPSTEKDDEMRAGLSHSCPNVAYSFYQILMLDYRVRVYLTKCLKERAGGPCDQCARSAASELAFCYTLGFGLQSDVNEAQKWLIRSDTSPAQLNQRVVSLKSLTTADIETKSYSISGNRGLFSLNVQARYGNENLKSTKAHIAQEIHDLEEQLGVHHWLLYELKIELISLLSAQHETGEVAEKAEALKLSTQQGCGASHPYRVRVDMLLADIYREQNRWDEAEMLLLEAKNVLIKELGAKHKLSIQASQDLARIYADRGKTEEAEREFAQLFKTVKETLHADHQLSSEVTIRYAAFLESQGRITEAGSLRSEHARESTTQGRYATLIIENERGRANLKGNPVLAETLLSKVKQDAESLAADSEMPISKTFALAAMMATRNMALAIRNQERFVEAEALQRDLKIKVEAALGQSDQETLNVTFDLARTLQMQSKWAEAEELQLIVKAGRKTLLGPTHEDTVSSSRQLASIYEAQNRLDEAENEMEAVREAYTKRLGPRHKDTLEATQRLALMYLTGDKLGLAEERLETTVSIAEHVLGAYHEETLGAKSNLGLVYSRQRRIWEAIALLERTLQDMGRHLGHQHRFTAITAHHLANLYGQQGRPQEAAALEPRNQPSGMQQDVLDLTSLSENEQLQLALELSLQTQPRVPESRGENEDDDDDEILRRAIAMSLETEGE